jgi:ABC-type uncharacterized transport system involved in gliding motility auxiliary subunit
VALMRAYARYAPILVVLGLAAALVAAALRLLEGEFNARVQVAIAVALVLLAGYLALEAESIQKWSGGRQARYGANAVAMSVAFVGIVGILNYLSNSRYHTDWDLTENQLNTLASQTVEVLQGLPETVRATAFISNQNQGYRDETRRLLERYQDESGGRFTFEILDPFVQRTRAAEMGVTRDSTIIFAMGDRREEVQFGDEQEFTAALIRLAHPEQRVVYFLVGHGEHDLADTSDLGYSKAMTGLERQNFTVQTLNLVVTNTVPSDAAAIVVAGPQVTLTVTETMALDEYLNGGGSVVALLNPTLQMREDQREQDPFVTWLGAAWGVQVHNDVVIDLASTQSDVAVAQQYGASPITDDLLSQQLLSYYPLARSIGVSAEAAEVPPANPLALTGDQSWGETDLATQPQPDDGVDNFGPLTLAVTVEDPATQARLIVFGDSDFAANAHFDQFANGDMLLNSVNWATGNTDLISIPPKDSAFRQPLDLSTRTIAALGIVSVCLLPFGVLLAGIAVVWNRRTRYK